MANSNTPPSSDLLDELASIQRNLWEQLESLREPNMHGTDVVSEVSKMGRAADEHNRWRGEAGRRTSHKRRIKGDTNHEDQRRQAYLASTADSFADELDVLRRDSAFRGTPEDLATLVGILEEGWHIFGSMRSENRSTLKRGDVGMGDHDKGRLYHQG